jgi:hypothetical protein
MGPVSNSRGKRPMPEFQPHIVGLATCTCVRCRLIRCGAVDADWDGWRDVEFAGYARVAMMRLVAQEPWLWCGPKTRWAGCVPWFSTLGQALDFDNAEAVSNGVTFPPIIPEDDRHNLIRGSHRTQADQTYAEMDGARAREDRGEDPRDLWPEPVIEGSCAYQRDTALGPLQKTFRWVARTMITVFLARPAAAVERLCAAVQHGWAGARLRWRRGG